ncbi:MAG TPA: class 1 fructose-bisphosphatase [Acidimicrobiales bacterium]|nr:class 1 fructose-bisphosphatase [Acidimicrobiales bacterium]
MSLLTGLTLSEQFFRDQAQSGASGDLSTVLNRVSLAARMLASEIMRAGFVGKLGLTGDSNVQGEQVRELDIISNDIISQVMDHAPMIAGIGSEEREDVYAMPGSEHGKYVLTIDPLDGSGNVDVNGAMGTIFGIYRRAAGRAGEVADVTDFLQPGRDLVAAGYVLYGPSTMFVYTVGGSVNGFTLDRSIGTFFLTHPDIRIPEGKGSYAVNEANEREWDDTTRSMVAAFRRQETRCGPRQARYAGALVADMHRTLLKGGVFMYPPTSAKPEGKLRLLYENAPLAFITAHAGGAATDGEHDILDITPQALHQRTPLYIGSRGDVEEVQRLLAHGG